MGQQRPTIFVLGGIFFLIIIIFGAIHGDYSLLIAIIDTLLIFLFAHWWRKRKLNNLGNSYIQIKSPIFTIFDRILIIVVGFFLALLPFFFGIFRWPWHRG